MSNIQKSEAKTVSALLSQENVTKRINDLLGSKAQQFCSSLIAISRQPQLVDCDPSSILGSAITAATLDLPINQNLGFAYIVPYNDKRKSKKEAQFQIGYKGIIQLALRSGQYAALNDAVIPCGCLESYNPLTGELKINFDNEKDGNPDGYAFYFELVNGFKKTVFWSYGKVQAHAKKFSQAYRSNYGPWKDDFNTMALKTVIKNALSKYGILSVEMQKAIEHDQAVIDATSDEVTLEYADNQEDSPMESMPQAEGITSEELLGDAKENELL